MLIDIKMKEREGLKMMAMIFLLIGGTKSDVLDELLSSVKILNDKMDKISLEQIKTTKKMDQLQNEVKSFSLDINSKLETFDEANNNKQAIDQLNSKMETLVTNLGTKIDNVNQDQKCSTAEKVAEEEGKP